MSHSKFSTANDELVEKEVINFIMNSEIFLNDFVEDVIIARKTEKNAEFAGCSHLIPYGTHLGA